MPQPTNENERPTVDVHAYWYNAATEPCDEVVTTLCLTNNEDEWEEVQLTDESTGQPLRYKERITIYESSLYLDQQYVQTNLYRKMRFNGGNTKPGADDLARTRTLLYLRRITEITDAKGQPWALTEASIQRMKERDITFIDAAISRLDNPPVPILDEDREKAARDFERQQQQIAAGYPVKDPLTEEEMASRIADAAFPPHADADFTGPRRPY